MARNFKDEVTANALQISVCVLHIVVPQGDFLRGVGAPHGRDVAFPATPIAPTGRSCKPRTGIQAA